MTVSTNYRLPRVSERSPTNMTSSKKIPIRLLHVRRNLNANAIYFVILGVASESSFQQSLKLIL